MNILKWLKRVLAYGGNVGTNSKKLFLNLDNADMVRHKIIAFDVETTGLDPDSCRIVEIGARVFENGRQTRSFSSLVNPHMEISEEVSMINSITNEMLAEAPDEKEVMCKLISFLEDNMRDEILLCAHNSSFHFSFLDRALRRNNMGLEFRYIDTLTLSRKYINDVENYRLVTIGEYFGIYTGQPNRVDSHTKTCGELLMYLLNNVDVFSK